MGGVVLFYDLRQFSQPLGKLESADDSGITRCDYQSFKMSKRATLSKSGEEPILTASSAIPIPSVTVTQEMPMFPTSPKSFEEIKSSPYYEDKSPFSPFDDRLKQFELSTKIETVKEDLQQKIQDVHVDLLRQFHVQQVINSIMYHYCFSFFVRLILI